MYPFVVESMIGKCKQVMLTQENIVNHLCQIVAKNDIQLMN
jgi:hypothetical protein